jgi:hypothetical protein
MSNYARQEKYMFLDESEGMVTNLIFYLMIENVLCQNDQQYSIVHEL